MSYWMRGQRRSLRGFGMDVSEAAAAYAAAVADEGGAKADLQMAQESGDAFQIAIAQAKLAGAQAQLAQAQADLSAAQAAAAASEPPAVEPTPTSKPSASVPSMPPPPRTSPPSAPMQQASMSGGGTFSGALPWILGGAAVLVVLVAASRSK